MKKSAGIVLSFAALAAVTGCNLILSKAMGLGDFTTTSTTTTTTTSTVPPVCVYISSSGNDANDGFTPSTPKATLEAGLSAAKDYSLTNICVHGNFAMSSPWYVEDISDATISGGWNANFTIQDGVSILNGNHTCAYIVKMDYCNRNILTNFVLTGAQSSSGTGGGLCLSSSYNNAIYCIITNNSADYGGGVYIGSGQSNNIAGLIAGNSAASSGGGILIQNGSVNNFVTARVIQNSAQNKGGGIAIICNAAIVNGFIISNTSGFDGGGVYINGNDCSLSNSVIQYNHCGSSYNGGGVYSTGAGNTIQSGAVYTPNFKGTGTTVTNNLYGSITVN